MEHLSHEEIKHHVKVYVRVFVTLLILTGLTVAVSYFHLPLLYAILVALAIAIFKGSLVAGFFMHLVSEKRIILYVLAATVPLFLTVLLIPLLAKFSTYVHQSCACFFYYRIYRPDFWIRVLGDP